jgi:DHA1 family bicyclomycin/chloramphenicol resistance-like MFS transporter
VARFVQGIGNAAPRVIAIAVVRDVYGGRKMAEVMSFVMMVFIMVPAIAPSIGGAILLFGDWHLIFVFLGAVSLAVIAWAGLRLPETRAPEDRAPLSVAWLSEALGQMLRTRLTLGYTLATGVLFGALLAYVSSAQQIFTEVYGLGAGFPLVFGVVALGMAAAGLINGRLVGRVGMRRMSHAALVGLLAFGLALAALAGAPEPPPLVVFVGMLTAALFCFGAHRACDRAREAVRRGRLRCPRADTSQSIENIVFSGCLHNV